MDYMSPERIGKGYRGRGVGVADSPGRAVGIVTSGEHVIRLKVEELAKAVVIHKRERFGKV